MSEHILQLRQAVEQALAYADVFAYPLSADEIFRYLPGMSASRSSIQMVLRDNPERFWGQNGLYTLPGRDDLLSVRQRRERVAAEMWPAAWRYGQIIAHLPFVRMVAVTGALAVNNVEAGADIDFLVVTEPGHLWLTRALVIALGRLAKLQGITLCPNYLVTLNALSFPDQSLYTAHELAQMVPIAGLQVYHQIWQQNAWALQYLPNAGDPPPGLSHIPRVVSSVGNWLGEAALSLSPFCWLEAWEMARKVRRLRQEQSVSQEASFSADVCKGHDRQHQAATRAAFAERLKVLESQ